MSKFTEEYDLKKITVFVLIVCSIVMVSAVGSIRLLRRMGKQDSKPEVAGVAQTVSKEDASIVEKVGKLYALPSDEQPTVATVTDLSKLANQPFFARAKLGDMVLLYHQNKLAILYDPVANKILEIGPLIAPTVQSFGTTVSPTDLPPSAQLTTYNLPASPAGRQPTTVSPPLRIALLNGTNDPQATDILEKEFTDIKDFSLQIVTGGDAAQKEYANTLVIDLTGRNEEITAKLAAKLNATVSPLPSGEQPPANADILLIVGINQS